MNHQVLVTLLQLGFEKLIRIDSTRAFESLANQVAVLIDTSDDWSECDEFTAVEALKNLMVVAVVLPRFQ